MNTVERQYQLEEESVAMGVAQYRETRAKRGEADMPPGQRLILDAIEPLSQAITEFCENRAITPKHQLGQIKTYLKSFDSDVVAFITARQCVNAIASRHSVSAVALEIANLLEDELNFSIFQEENAGLYRHVKEGVRKATSYRYKRILLKRSAKWAGITQEDWPHAEKIRLGARLIGIFCDSTQLSQIVAIRDKKWRKSTLQAAPETLEYLQKAHDDCALLFPVLLPMLVKPRPWQGARGGGYLSQKINKFPLVKTRNQQYIQELDGMDCQPVYQAVNALQDTAWRINRNVYDVLVEAWELGGDQELGLPRRDEMPLPLCPQCNSTISRMKNHSCFDDDKEVLKEWKKQASAVYEQNWRTKSKVAALAKKITIARRFKSEPRFYFPYQLDWRGRAYPLPVFLNPQGDDTAKGLLEFAQGKRLDKKALRWLMIHTANCYGYDKASLEDRVQWVKDHAEDIVASTVQPFRNRWWVEADKPYQFLACCYELDGYWNDPEGFVSHLPVAVDGACNGLQNFSAMLRDEVGGAAVNLIPADKPQDIYQQVADVVAGRIEIEAEVEGNKWAKLWVDKIDRKLVKRNVMTLPYGATQNGMCNQLIAELQKQATEKGHYYIADKKMWWPACRYLAEIVYKAIGEVVVAARQAMDWLQEAARVVSKGDLPIHWKAPTGLRVMQKYNRYNTKRLELIIGSVRLQTVVHEETNALDKRKQTQGIAPNYVHSMDAAHMMLSINKCYKVGLRAFSMVHDSYGCLAADMEILSFLLREAFCEMYSVDVLNVFREDLLDQIPEKLQDKLPELPDFGSLDLRGVEQSEYFFA